MLVSAAAACALLTLLPAHGAIPELADGGTYATGQTNRKAQASVRGAAYPPQWLPVLLLTAAASPSPPSPFAARPTAADTAATAERPHDSEALAFPDAGWFGLRWG